MLIFCPGCGSIMTLKEKRNKLGVYTCRKCGGIKKIKTKAIEKRESINYIAPPVPI